jgi:hypothetical protein
MITNSRTSPDGKSGLEVLMLIIDTGLAPGVDENQGILAGPVIANLLHNVSRFWQVDNRRLKRFNLIYPCY